MTLVEHLAMLKGRFLPPPLEKVAFVLKNGVKPGLVNPGTTAQSAAST